MILRSSLLALVPAALVAIVLAVAFPIAPWLAWLLAITVATFLTFGYDKRIAGSHRMRVPEMTLLLLTGVGGTLGAMAGMAVFHHKTSKSSFQLRFWMVVVLQIMVIASFVLWIRARA
jgi:uncharacterized membrane protein YsdA (DUF1294 family)